LRLLEVDVSASDALAWARDVLDYANAVRSYSFGGFGFDGGRDEKHQYKVWAGRS
jgi:hypothetical protein